MTAPALPFFIRFSSTLCAVLCLCAPLAAQGQETPPTPSPSGGLRMVLEPQSAGFTPSTVQLEQVKTLIAQRLSTLKLAGVRVLARAPRQVWLELSPTAQRERQRVLTLALASAKLEFRVVKASANNKAEAQLSLSDLEKAGADGSFIAGAQPTPNPSGRWLVSFQIVPQKVEAFKSFTRQNIGKRLAIVLDGQVKSAPTLQAELSGGAAISGNFDARSSADLAALLSKGTLPYTLKIVSEQAF